MFFLVVNTAYFWEGKLGLLALPIFLILFFVYFVLVIGFIIQLYFTIREKFKNKQGLVLLTFLTVVIILTYIRPNGFIDFDRLQGADLLVATAEGGGNSSTTLKLKENNRFIQRIVSFGVDEIKGTYKIKNDTIFFENVEFNLGRSENKFYQYAVIMEPYFSKHYEDSCLVMYKNIADTNGCELMIKKNELTKLNTNAPNH